MCRVFEKTTYLYARYYYDEMLTAADKAANFKVAQVNGTWYKDISKPLNTALPKVTREAEAINANAIKYERLPVVTVPNQKLVRYAWFITKVYHGAPWDIKLKKPWNDTIAKGTYPGWGVKVYYNGNLMDPEELGNYTYGYIGHALGLSLSPELYGGSWVAAGLPTSGGSLASEFEDWPAIKKGYNAYK